MIFRLATVMQKSRQHFKKNPRTHKETAAAPPVRSKNLRKFEKFEKFHASKAGLLSGKTLVSPFKRISKKVVANCPLP